MREYSNDYDMEKLSLAKEGSKIIKTFNRETMDKITVSFLTVSDDYRNVFSKMNLFQDFTENERQCTTIRNNDSMFPEINNKDVIYMDEIIDKYLLLGFNNMKISGRNAADHCAKSLAQYFFKPEYKLAGFCYILDVGRN